MAVSRAAKPHQDYVWYAVPTTGDLGAATYWYDLTTSAPATKAPGAADSATIYGVYVDSDGQPDRCQPHHRVRLHCKGMSPSKVVWR